MDQGSVVSPERVSAQLERLLESDRLHASPRLRAFLRFVVQESLEGRAGQLNQYRIAIDVFGRGDSFDPAADPSVRVEAGKLRRALAPSRAVGPAAARPAITVAPIRVVAASPALQNAAEALIEELLVALASFPHLRVVRGNADPEATDCWVLRGSLRARGSLVRLTIRLEDTRSRVQDWADAFEICLDGIDPSAIAGRVAVRVGDIDGVMTRRGMSAAVHSRGDDSFTAAMAFHHYMRSFARDSYWHARRAVESALVSDPRSADLVAMMADLCRGGYLHGFDSDRSLLSRGSELARRSVALDPGSAFARLSLGYTRLAEHRVAGAIRQAEVVLGMPSMTARGDAGLLLALAGERKRAMQVIQRSVEALGTFPGWFRHVFFLDAYLAGDFERALEEAEQIGLPHLPWDAIDRAAALGMMGEVDQAGVALSQLLALRPDFASQRRRYIEGFAPQREVREALLTGLGKAGLSTPVAP
jgi:TolB-like protein